MHTHTFCQREEEVRNLYFADECQIVGLQKKSQW